MVTGPNVFLYNRNHSAQKLMLCTHYRRAWITAGLKIMNFIPNLFPPGCAVALKEMKRSI